MSKRYGRNQKRKHVDEIDRLTRRVAKLEKINDGLVTAYGRSREDLDRWSNHLTERVGRYHELLLIPKTLAVTNIEQALRMPLHQREHQAYWTGLPEELQERTLYTTLGFLEALSSSQIETLQRRTILRAVDREGNERIYAHDVRDIPMGAPHEEEAALMIAKNIVRHMHQDVLNGWPQSK
jgi:hypothetical protein